MSHAYRWMAAALARCTTTFGMTYGKFYLFMCSISYCDSDSGVLCAIIRWIGPPRLALPTGAAWDGTCMTASSWRHAYAQDRFCTHHASQLSVVGVHRRRRAGRL